MRIELSAVGLEALPSANLLQSEFWGRFKSGFGWRAQAFMIDCGDHGLSVPLLVLVKDLPAGLKLAYVPHGPDPGGPLPGDPCDCLEEISRRLRPLLPTGTLFIRWDVPWPRESLCRPFRKAPVDVQPAATVVLDLGRTDDELLAAMKPKTRYNILLAERRGVQVEEGSAADLGAWYGLYQETAARDCISIHSMEYYRRQFEVASRMAAARAPRLRLFLARHQGRLLAGLISAAMAGRCVYLYGASSSEGRNLMPAYLLQWRAMQQARRDGAHSYDLFGIPPADDPDHHLYGLYRFKTGFGGEILRRPGSYDLPLMGPLYAAYGLAEALRTLYHHRIKKRRSRSS